MALSVCPQVKGKLLPQFLTVFHHSPYGSA
jgi:hypothetical protein